MRDIIVYEATWVKSTHPTPVSSRIDGSTTDLEQDESIPHTECVGRSTCGICEVTYFLIDCLGHPSCEYFKCMLPMRR
jgi:hypothetical protein